MNLFNIDLFQKTLDLIKETLKLKKYKAMPNILAIFVFIFMFPFIVLSFFIAALVLYAAFVIRVLKFPVESLRTLVNSEGKEIKHATQFIVYFISWPFIFVLYIIISFINIYIYVGYALLSCINYLWSLGGFKFHLFAEQADNISIQVNEKYNVTLLIAYVAIMAALVIFIQLIDGINLYIELYEEYNEHLFLEYYFSDLVFYIRLGAIFSIFYGYIGLCPRPSTSVIKLEDKL